jgi:hypothetical protein
MVKAIAFDAGCQKRGNYHSMLLCTAGGAGGLCCFVLQVLAGRHVIISEAKRS